MPARKPASDKLLKGTYKASRDGDPGEDVPADGVPEPPSWLGVDALALWSDVVPGLVGCGLATARDSHALAAMCDYWGQWRRMRAEMDLPGIRPADLRQYAIVAGVAFDKFEKLAGKFGLNPADRAKLRVQPGKSKGVESRKRG